MPDVPLIDIRPDHWAIVQGILQKHVPQYTVWAFGSRATWKAKEYSDLDLAIITGQPLSLDVNASLSDDFSNSDLPWKVDIVDWATTSESFRKIIAEAKVVVQEGEKKTKGMGSEWRDVILQDVFEINPPREIKREIVIPFVPMDALSGHAREIMRIDMREFLGSGSRFKNGDTILARITPCLENGKTAYVSGLEDNVVAHGSTEYIVIAEKRNVSDGLFAYYLVRSPEFRAYAIGHMEGTSGRQRVPTDAVAKFCFNLPPLPEQRAIAHILGTLDDKIELNRRMNETLEAMARALFKAWFVDFEPVRAKAEGRWQRGQSLPGLPAHLYDLFPGQLVESEFGEIPEGWQTLPVYDIAAYVNGAAFKAFQPNDEGRGLPIIKIAELKAGVTAQTKFSDVAMPEKYRLRTGDILFSWSGNPDTSIDTFIWAHGDAWLNQHIFRVDIHSPSERAFVIATLKYLRPVFAEIARNKQTTGLGHVTVGDMQRFLVVKPEEQALAAWDRMAAPIFATVFRNEADAISLGRLRDTLLPKLISGELRIADLETFNKQAEVQASTQNRSLW